MAPQPTTYFHSVELQRKKCQGCVSCVKLCPTEAIRVRNGKAEILGDRCIDCGACAAGCPYHAFNVKTDTLDGLADYAYNIVLPAPSLYAQFPDNIPLESIWQGLHNIGFDEIFDVSLASEYIALEIEEYVKSVVSGEMLVSFDDEALKAQAIAARTYIAAKRLRPCNIANGGDVCDTTHCQVYINKDVRLEQWGSNAEEYWNKISNAVDNTKGMVLTYNNELVLYPQFFSTSSGMTENAVDVFSNSVPYLVSTESKGEEIAPKYETEFPFNIPEFVNKINDKYKEASITSENLKNNI